MIPKDSFDFCFTKLKKFMSDACLIFYFGQICIFKLVSNAFNGNRCLVEDSALYPLIGVFLQYVLDNIFPWIYVHKGQIREFQIQKDKICFSEIE